MGPHPGPRSHNIYRQHCNASHPSSSAWLASYCKQQMSLNNVNAAPPPYTPHPTTPPVNKQTSELLEPGYLPFLRRSPWSLHHTPLLLGAKNVHCRYTHTHTLTTRAIMCVCVCVCERERGGGGKRWRKERGNVNTAKRLILLKPFINKSHLAPARYAVSEPEIMTPLLSGDLAGETEVCTG